jgi:hypothetical protein
VLLIQDALRASESKENRGQEEEETCKGAGPNGKNSPKYSIYLFILKVPIYLSIYLLSLFSPKKEKRGSFKRKKAQKNPRSAASLRRPCGAIFAEHYATLVPREHARREKRGKREKRGGKEKKGSCKRKKAQKNTLRGPSASGGALRGPSRQGAGLGPGVFCRGFACF